MDWSFDTSDQKTLPGSVQTPLGFFFFFFFFSFLFFLILIIETINRTFGISLNYRTNCDFEESQVSFLFSFMISFFEL